MFMNIRRHMSGSELLDQFLKENGIGRDAAAKALNVSRTALYYWLIGDTSPGEQARRDVDVWTGGKVPADSWGPPADHRKEPGKVEPFKPSGSAA